jgi:hypothetical protein
MNQFVNLIFETPPSLKAPNLPRSHFGSLCIPDSVELVYGSTESRVIEVPVCPSSENNLPRLAVSHLKGFGNSSRLFIAGKPGNNLFVYFGRIYFGDIAEIPMQT